MARAALRPDEVAIVAVRASRQSRELAEYYANARGIPKSQICLIECAPGEGLSRPLWETKVRPAIRRWLHEHQLDQQIRCLVTVWDVPLKIGLVDAAGPQVVALKEHLTTQHAARRQSALKLAAQIDQVLPAARPEQRTPLKPDAPHKELAALLEAAVRGAQERIHDEAQTDQAQASRASKELERLYLRAGGVASALRLMQGQLEGTKDPSIELVRGFELRRGEVAGVRLGLNAVAALPESVSRDRQFLGLLEQTDGVLGTLAWIEQQQELWQKNETWSSFDNELALVLWPDYPLLRWQNSALHHAFAHVDRESLPRTMIVARLEAPSFERAKQLVDTAIAIEREGLSGKFYIDCRGLPAEKTPGSAGDYDQNLRDLAALVKEHTRLEVVVENTGNLFQPGECPDAALYCGWYSLANYVDAFIWKPGAVAYHIASSEADTLRKPASNVWCKKLLEHGVCATVGPTFEPYLIAFPRPLEFYSLLLTGKLPLAEVYAYTLPHTSWVMVLVGDPLFNPFQNSPQLDVQHLPPPLRELIGDER